jgi:hypothetical protein
MVWIAIKKIGPARLTEGISIFGYYHPMTIHFSPISHFTKALSSSDFIVLFSPG